MTYTFAQKQFKSALQSPTLVLVDLCRRNLTRPTETSRATAAGILVRCRAALAHARRTGIPVTFVRDRTGGRNDFGKAEAHVWIHGFEPKRHESVFERIGPSCYDSPYFEEIMNGAGRHIVIAGFVGRGGCLATAADAVRAGHAITFLKDGICDDLSGRTVDYSLVSSLAALMKFDIRTVKGSHWIASSDARFPQGRMSIRNWPLLPPRYHTE